MPTNRNSVHYLETEYLGYIITRDGVKPQHNKVQAILAISPPKNVKELRRFLGMIQYYRDIWAKCRKQLAPLTDLVGECGQTKASTSKSLHRPSELDERCLGFIFRSGLPMEVNHLRIWTRNCLY